MPFVIVLLCLCTSTALANTYTWKGNAPPPNNNLWSQPQNWSPSTGVPGAGDTAIINSPGVGTIYVDQTVTVANLTAINVNGLLGGGSLTVSGTLEAQNSVFGPAGGTTITGAGSLSVDPVPNIPVYNTTTITSLLTLNGSANVSSNAVLSISSGATVINNRFFTLADGAKLTLASSGAWFVNNSSFTGDNAICSSGSSIFSNAPSGAVYVNDGKTLQMQGTLASSGTFQAVGGGLINISAATAMHDGASFTGEGTTLLTGNNTLDGTVTVAGNLQFNGYAVTLNGTLEVNAGGNFDWLGGTLTGVGTNVTGTILVDFNGTLLMNELNTMTLRNANLTNNGTVNWTNSGTIFMGYNAQIDNGGLFNVFGDGGLEPLPNGSPGYGVATFNNGNGTFQKQQGSTNSNAATTIGIPFYDGGVIVEQGNVAFTAGGSIDTWEVASNGAVQLKGGTYSLKSEYGLGGGGKIEGLVGDGAGAVTMNSSVTLDFPVGSALVVQGGKFIQSGGTINAGFAYLFVNNGGLFVWNGGTIDGGSISIGQGSVMNISGGSSTKNLGEFTSIANQGSVNWTNANSVGVINAGDNVFFDNAGQFNIGCDSYFNDTSTNFATRPVFTNEVTGVITKAGTSGTTTIGIELVNLGKIVPVQGNLEIGEFHDPIAGLKFFNYLDMEGGEITFDEPAIIYEDVDGSGTIDAKHGLTFTDDEVDIYLIIFYGDITNDGTFILFFGSPGDATFQNNFSQTANGRVVIPIRGTNAITKDFGQLIVSGFNQVFLNGTLELHVINGFAPPVGATFSLLTSFQRNGTFSNAIIPQGMKLNYTPGGATLVVTGAVPVQIISPAVTNGQFQFGFNTISNRSYTLQSCDNLTTGTWTFLTNFTGDGTYWQPPPLSPLVPQRFYRVSNP